MPTLKHREGARMQSPATVTVSSEKIRNLRRNFVEEKEGMPREEGIGHSR